MFFCDPNKCLYCQNNGYFDDLVKGQCHRCNVRSILNACVTSNVKRGNTALAISQLRILGF